MEEKGTGQVTPGNSTPRLLPKQGLTGIHLIPDVGQSEWNNEAEKVDRCQQLGFSKSGKRKRGQRMVWWAQGGGEKKHLGKLQKKGFRRCAKSREKQRGSPSGDQLGVPIKQGESEETKKRETFRQSGATQLRDERGARTGRERVRNTVIYPLSLHRAGLSEA